MDHPTNRRGARGSNAMVRRGRRALNHGRTLSISRDGGSDLIEVTTTDGQVEVSIAITENGPVLRLRGARFEIDSSDTVAINCRQLELNTSEGFKLSAGGDIGMRTRGEVRVKSDRQTFIDGDWVNLNCLDRNGYHDDPARQGKGQTESTDEDEPTS